MAITEQITVSHSQVRAGGAIVVKSQILTETVVHKKVIVELVFNVRPHQELLLEIAPSDEHHLLENHDIFLRADKYGEAIVHLKLVPLVAGKQYLRLIASHANGDNGRAIAIVLPVTDDTGEMPEQEKEIKDRIEFESLPVQ